MNLNDSAHILIVLTTLPLIVAAGFAVTLAVLGRRRKKSAILPVIGMTGTAVTSLNPGGTVSLEGTLWRAQAGEKISASQTVRVTGYNGAVLVVTGAILE